MGQVRILDSNVQVCFEDYMHTFGKQNCMYLINGAHSVVLKLLPIDWKKIVLMLQDIIISNFEGAINNGCTASISNPCQFNQVFRSLVLCSSRDSLSLSCIASCFQKLLFNFGINMNSFIN